MDLAGAGEGRDVDGDPASSVAAILAGALFLVTRDAAVPRLVGGFIAAMFDRS